MTAEPPAWRADRWQLWRVGRATTVYVMVVDLLALAAVTWSLWHARPAGSQLVDVGVLMVLSIGFDELMRRIENQRLGVARGAHADMRSVWALAAAATLPVSLVALLAAVMYGQLSLTGARNTDRVAPYRSVCNAATMTLCGVAVHVVTESVALRTVADHRWGAPLVVALVVVAYFLAETVLVAAALASVSGRVEVAFLGSRSANTLELGTLGLGGVVALAGSPAAGLLVLPAMYLLHRSALVDDLQTAATQDAKTGLYNAAAWRARADRLAELATAREQALSVLVIDIDHFKAVNEAHGHVVGDRVLAAVATCLTDTLRDDDVVGRFGGEEFVAVLPALRTDEARRVAERVRTAVARCSTVVTPAGVVVPAECAEHADHAGVAVRVTVSVGVAEMPRHGDELDPVFAAADAAVFAAKRAGRDRVAVAPDPAVSRA